METNVLTPKQQKFCDEYLIDLNATRAALRAGYSASTALSGALMRLPKIAAYLQERTATASREAGITQQMVLAELGKIAFGNMANYYHSDGRLKGVHELTADEAAALWCMKITDSKEGQTTFIRLNNKLSALEKIAKHLGFYYAEPDAQQKEYVIVEKDKLTEDDLFDDEELAREQEDAEDDWDDEDDDWDAEIETEEMRIDRLTRERYNLLNFYPELDKVLPSGPYLTDEILTRGLNEFTTRRHDEPWCLATIRAGNNKDGWYKPRTKVEPNEYKPDEDEDEPEDEELADVVEAQAPKPSGRCEVPFMMGNSKEYRN